MTHPCPTCGQPATMLAEAARRAARHVVDEVRGCLTTGNLKPVFGEHPETIIEAAVNAALTDLALLSPRADAVLRQASGPASGAGNDA